MRQLFFLLTISVGLAGVIFFELEPGSAPSEAVLARPATTDQGQPAAQSDQGQPAAQSDQGRPVPQPTANDSVTTSLAQPLLSPSRRPPETVKSEGLADPTLSDIRLTGIVIEPDRRLAIFAVAGAKPRTLLLGEALNGWKLDSISPEEVSLSGPGGTRTLQPKIDTKLVRQARLPAAPAQPPPAAALGQAPGRPQAGVPPGRTPIPPQAAVPPVPGRAGAPGQPVVGRPPLPLRPSVPSAPVRPQ